MLAAGVAVDPPDEVTAWTDTDTEEAGGGPAARASLACPVTGSRYQFAGGSPRQSPTVTRSYPRPLAVSIMNWARWCTVDGWTSCASEIH